MRVTTTISANQAIDNILDNYSRLLTIQNQMAKGQSVINPSDDPLAVNEAIRIQTILSQIEQYERNIAVGNSMLGLSDTALQSVNDIESNARSLTVGMANDSVTPDARHATVIEVQNILSELVSIGNRISGDRYLFGGTQTTKPPFELVGTNYVNFTGNSKDISLQVDRDAYVPVNVKAEDVFGSLVTNKRSDSLAPKLNMDVNTATRLEDLNRGRGVADGSIHLRYLQSTPPDVYEDIDIDLRGADTLEDVADIISRETNGEVLVTQNNSATGINVANAILPGSSIEITEVANNTTARDLGIRKTAPAGTISGDALNPQVVERTLLSDIPGYFGTALSIHNGPDDLLIPTVSERSDVNNLLSGISFGTTPDKGVNTDLDGNLYFSVDTAGAPPYSIEVYKDAARNPEDLVARGVGAVGSTITLTEQNSSGLNGSVVLDNNIGALDDTIEMAVTFPDTFSGSVQVEAFQETGDGQNQLSAWQLHGLRRGVDTAADGSLDVEIVGGNTVNIINPVTAAVIATGNFASNWQTVTLAGTPGNEHISGSVDIEYVANDNTIGLQATFNTMQDLINAVEASGAYTDAEVTSDGEAFKISSRLAGATLHVVENSPAMAETNDANNDLARWDIRGLEYGTNCDVDGTLYAELQQSGADYVVNLYKDSARTELMAAGSVLVAGGTPQTVTLTEAPGSNSGLSGTVELSTYTADNATIEIAPKSIGLSCKKREDNIFSTLNDVIDAGLSDDTETLHDLIGNFDVDINRVLGGRAQIGARVERFDLLTNRLKDESTSFSEILSKRIDLDYAEAVVKFQQESNIFNAALSVAGKIIPMSLVDFI